AGVHIVGMAFAVNMSSMSATMAALPLLGLLADGAIEGGAARLDDAPDRALAAGGMAGLVFPVIDVETVLETAGRPLGIAENAEGRAPRLDGVGENPANAIGEEFEA